MTNNSTAIYRFGPFEFDHEDLSLTREGEAVPLRPQAAKVLLVLVRAQGRLVTRDELSTSAWPDTNVIPTAIDYQIHELRDALGDRDYIETRRGRGFRVTVPVTIVPRSAAPVTSDEVAGDTGKPVSPAAATLPLRGRRAVLWSAVALTLLVAAFTLANRPASRLRITEYLPLTRDQVPKHETPLLTDGTRVFYETGPEPTVYAVSIQGGEATPFLQAPAEFAILDVNPTRREYLAKRRQAPGADQEGSLEAQLWVLPVASGNPRRLGNLQCHYAAWSADGRQLACAHKHLLYVARADGSAVRELPSPGGGSVAWPRWSPDAKLLRFTRVTIGDRRAPVRSLWEIKSDGTGLRQLVPGLGDLSEACCGNWDPAGHYYVFQSPRDGRTDLWALRERSGLIARSPQLVQLTAGPLNFTGAVFSRDGKTLYAVGSHSQGELMRFDFDRREFLPYLRGVSGTWMTFSPDGQSLAYIGYPDAKLWRARADGRAKQQLTFGPFDSDGSMWSPDGKWIAFRSRMGSKHMRIYVIHAEGGEARPISTEDQEQGIPSWSPDGQRLAFGDVPEVYGQPSGTEVLHIYDVAQGTFSDVPGSQGLWTCRWSPDGRYLAALTIKERRLRLFDFSSRTWREIRADHIDNPTWSGDSRFIYYHTEGSESRLRRVRIADGRVEELADLSGYHIAAYWWSGLTPDGSPIVLRNLGATEVYALHLDTR